MRTYIDSGYIGTLSLKELLSFKGLLYNLTKRDIKVRYKQTRLGMFWGVLKPLMNITVFGVIALFINKSQNRVETFLHVSAGVLVWNLITNATTEASNCLVGNAGLLTKVYFPKIILLINAVVVTLIDFAVSFIIFLLVYFILGGHPGLKILLVPFFIILALTFCLGLAFFFSTMLVKFRDIGFLLPFILQFGFYVSPVFLDSDFYLNHLPGSLQVLFAINPTTSILDGMKYCFFDKPFVYDISYFWISVAINFLLFGGGIIYFLRKEKQFADYI